MNRTSLDYVGIAHNRPKPWPRTGVEYLHHFGTGHQVLVFDNHDQALRFANREHCTYSGPAVVIAAPIAQAVPVV